MPASDHSSIARAKIRFFLGLGLLIGLLYHSVLGTQHIPGYGYAMVVVLTIAALAFDYLKLNEFLRALRDRATSHGSQHAAVRAALKATLDSPLLLKLAGRELLTLYYAFFARFERREAVSHDELFSYEKSSNARDVFLFVALSQLPFLPFIHVFLEHRKGPAPAWVVTLVTLWSVIWYLAQVQAVGFRPIELGHDQLKYRFGLLWEAEIPLASIRLARHLEPAENLRAGDLFVSAPGSKKNVILEFDTPVEFHGAYFFKRRKTRAAISLDEPSAFLGQLARRGVATG